MADDPREPYGRLVHDTRLAHEADQAAAEGRARFHLKYWEERTEAQHELDMRIGSAVAAQAVHDAGLETELVRAQILLIAANLAAIRRALTIAITVSEYEAEKKPYRDLLQAFSSGEEQGADPVQPVMPGQLPLPGTETP